MNALFGWHLQCKTSNGFRDSFTIFLPSWECQSTRSAVLSTESPGTYLCVGVEEKAVELR